ncbi:hypothetical protein ACIQ9P_32285 [Kitasatospora sp. NPDC094019]|uniref:hypothetical protein n=1 Tax=Kitasatospora sp. NPDC094019 TaxID=3364091 RepID=UPI0037FBCF75
MHKHVRLIAVAVAVTASLTAAAPLASAAAQPRHTLQTTASAATADTETVTLTANELAQIRLVAAEFQEETAPGTAAPEYTTYSGKGDVAKKIVSMLKKSPKLFKSAIGKAKEGKGAFDGWMGKQNILVRGAYWAAGGYAQSEVIDYLASLTN